MKTSKLESDTSRPVLVTVLNTGLSGERRWYVCLGNRGNESTCNSPGER